MNFFNSLRLIGLIFFLLGTFAYTFNWLPENISRPMYLIAGIVMVIGLLLRKKE